MLLWICWSKIGVISQNIHLHVYIWPRFKDYVAESLRALHLFWRAALYFTSVRGNEGQFILLFLRKLGTHCMISMLWLNSKLAIHVLTLYGPIANRWPIWLLWKNYKFLLSHCQQGRNMLSLPYVPIIVKKALEPKIERERERKETSHRQVYWCHSSTSLASMFPVYVSCLLQCVLVSLSLWFSIFARAQWKEQRKSLGWDWGIGSWRQTPISDVTENHPKVQWLDKWRIRELKFGPTLKWVVHLRNQVKNGVQTIQLMPSFTWTLFMYWRRVWDLLLLEVVWYLVVYNIPLRENKWCHHKIMQSHKEASEISTCPDIKFDGIKPSVKCNVCHHSAILLSCDMCRQVDSQIMQHDSEFKKDLVKISVISVSDQVCFLSPLSFFAVHAQVETTRRGYVEIMKQSSVLKAR